MARVSKHDTDTAGAAAFFCTHGIVHVEKKKLLEKKLVVET